MVDMVWPRGARYPAVCLFFFQAEDGIRDLVRSRGLGDVYKRQIDDILAMTLRINDFLTGLFAGAQIKLVDFKVEYGLSLIHI